MAEAPRVATQEPDGPRRIFRNKDFLLLWFGQFVSQVGDRVHSIALMWWILEETGSAALMGTVLIAATVPAIILGPFAGGYVDRWNRKAVIVVADLFRGGIILIVAALAIHGRLEVWHLLVGTAFVSMASVFFGPAVHATIPNIVRRDELTRANSLSQVVTQVTGIAGPALGGLLVAFWGVAGIFLLNGLSYVASAVSEMFISVPATEADGTGQRHILAELKDGFDWIRARPAVFGLLKTAAVLNFFSAPFAVLLPIAVRDLLHKGPDAFGLLMSVFSVGFLVASVLLAVIKERERKHPLIIWGIAAGGVCLVLLGVFLHYPAYIVLMAMLGIMMGLANIAIAAHFQAVVPDERRGRVFGFMGTLSGGLQPLAFGIIGLLADAVSVPVVFMVCGGAIVLGGFYLLLIPGMREI